MGSGSVPVDTVQDLRRLDAYPPIRPVRSKAEDSPAGVRMLEGYRPRVYPTAFVRCPFLPSNAPRAVTRAASGSR